MRIAVVSDAWRPQINGVVRTIETVAQLLRADGHDVEVFGPDRFRTLPCPSYPEIRLSLFPRARLAHMPITTTRCIVPLLSRSAVRPP